jgi:hypothetical protein
MNVLPAIAMIATDAIRRQFAPAEPRVPDRHPAAPVPSRIRLALAALLERAAHAVAPAGYRPAH